MLEVILSTENSKLKWNWTYIGIGLCRLCVQFYFDCWNHRIIVTADGNAGSVVKSKPWACNASVFNFSIAVKCDFFTLVEIYQYARWLLDEKTGDIRAAFGKIQCFAVFLKMLQTPLTFCFCVLFLYAILNFSQITDLNYSPPSPLLRDIVRPICW